MKHWYTLQHRWTLKTSCYVKMPVTQDHVLYDSVYMKCPEWGKSIETGSRLDLQDIWSIRALKVRRDNRMLIDQDQGQEEVKPGSRKQTLYLRTKKLSSLAEIYGTKRWTAEDDAGKNRYGSGQERLYILKTMRNQWVWQEQIYPSVNIFGNQICYHIINSKRWQWSQKVTLMPYPQIFLWGRHLHW